MRFSRARFAFIAAFGASLVSCNDGPVTPAPRPLGPGAISADAAPVTKVVISQVYGGGGNANATIKNDFIEVFNAGNTTVDVSTWSVQYASAAGTSWQKTNLSGSLAPGQYFLVQEAAGTGNVAPLPTPDATGSIAMSATAGKVALVSNQTLLAVACPAGSPVVDFVGFGTGASGATCFEGTAATATLSNTTAAIRKTAGCTDADNNSADFATGAPTPRNTATTLAPCGTVTPPTVGPLDHVTIGGGSSVTANATLTLSAALFDASNQTITDPSATYAWTSADPATVSIQSTTANTATIKGLKAGGPIAVDVSVTSNGVTKTATQQITVNAPPSAISVSVGAGLPLVIGYQTQVFASGADASGNPVNSGNVTWSTSDPTILVVSDPRGVVTAVGNGSAKVIATAEDGSTGTFTISTEVPLYNATARVGHNTEFGVPVDADPSNDVIIARDQYTISYNPQRGGPNWVSWDISASHLGSRNRCNCYSADTALARLGYAQFMYNTADYTGGGYDRGHMEPSADQTATDGENARTFFLTNFLPQKHGLNAGPWESLENALRDSVKAGREAYVIAGGTFTNGVGLGTINNAGKIAIPDSTWKIVVLMPAGTGLANVTAATDIDVIAVNMPNVDSPGTNDWTAFKTTVAKIQKSTGYDFLAALPDPIECKVEASDCAPTAHIVGTTTGNEGQTITFDGTTSSDPDAGDVLSYQWSVNGQTASIQPTLAYAFADNGTYTVQLIVADAVGRGDTTKTLVTIANVAPTIALAAPATVNEGDPIQLVTSGASDPSSADVAAGLKIEVDCGAGTGYVVTPSVGTTTCPTTDNGTRVVRARITDKDGGIGEVVRTVTIANVAPATTFSAVTPLHILSGLVATVKGGFTDPGPDAPWQYAIDWKDGTTKTGSFTSSGSSTIQIHQYLAAGTYTVPFTVTDKDGGTSTSTLVVQVDRLPIDGDVNPSSIKLNDNGNGNITVKLSSVIFLASAVDVSTVRIGTAKPTKDHTEQGGTRLSLDFSRKDLIAAGVLTASTTEIVVTATLTSGVQIESHIPVDVH